MEITNTKKTTGYCAACEKDGMPIEIITANIPVEYKGKDMMLKDSIFRRCLDCGGEFENSKDDRPDYDEYENMYKEYEEKYGKIDNCPFCDGIAELEINHTIFKGQNYSNKYPPEVATQMHGFRIRCIKCGGQTCWWHYEEEARKAWKKRYKAVK